MKKLLSIVILGVIILTACSNSTNNDLSIKPSKFSEETKHIIDILNKNVQFYDIQLNGKAKSHKLSIWRYIGDKWHEDVSVFGEIRFLGNQIAIEVNKDKWRVFINKGDGYEKTYCPISETEFNNSKSISIYKITSKRCIELNKEIPIYLKIGTDKKEIRVIDITKDFRNYECNAGLVVTLTLYDKEDKFNN